MANLPPPTLSSRAIEQVVSTPVMASGYITLDVSGRKFRTSKSVLSVSPYFENLLTRWEDCADLQADGSYYVDADADTFVHVLNFMRRPSRFPLYWTKKDGLDYALYCRVEAEADYFMLEELRDWIKQRKYLKAVVAHLCTHEARDFQRLHGNFVVEKHVVRRAGNVLCPFAMHSYPKHDCWRDEKCRSAMAANGVKTSDPTDELLVVITEFHFDNTVLVNDTP